MNLLLSANLFPNTPDEVNVDEKGNIITENGTSGESVFSTLIDLGNQGTLKFMDWGIFGITIIFVLGVILMIMSTIFKVGQWQRIAQTTMLWSFITMICLRAIPITILSFRSDLDVDQAFQAALNVLSHTAIFLGITGILLSLLFKFGHKLIDHPEYHRWSKNILSVSFIMIFFAFVGPLLFGSM